MTPTTRKEVLDYVLDIIEIPKSVGITLTDDFGIKSIGILINTDEKALLDDEDISLAHVTAISLFTEWLKEYIDGNDNEPPENWSEAFTESIWDRFILKRGADTASSTSGSSNSKNEGDTKEENKVPGIIPTFFGSRITQNHLLY